MSKPKLERIVDRFKKGKNFSLSREEYIRLTGADIPQSASYTRSSSAIAKRAKEYGYQITVIPETLVFTRIDGGEEN